MKTDSFKYSPAILKKIAPTAVRLGILGFALTATASAQNLYIGNNFDSATGESSTYIGVYDTTTGTAIDDRLIDLGEINIRDMLISGETFYVLHKIGENPVSIGTYDAADGTTLDNQFIPDLKWAQSMALSGSEFYVSRREWIGQYDANSGETINLNWDTQTSGSRKNYHHMVASDSDLYANIYNTGAMHRYDLSDGSYVRSGFFPFIPPQTNKLRGVKGMALSDGKIYVTGHHDEAVRKFDAETGELLDATFITDLTQPYDIAISGNDLFVIDLYKTGTPWRWEGRVGKYNATTGAAIDREFITGLVRPQKLAIIDDSDPGNGDFASWPVLESLPAEKRDPEDRNGPLGLPNLLAYAMNLHPLLATVDDLPSLSETDSNENRITFRYRRGTNNDVTLSPMTSSNLTDWNPAEILSTEIIDTGENWEIVEIEVPAPSQETLFFRLVAE